jgi:DNA-binding response OmpR family regulator
MPTYISGKQGREQGQTQAQGNGQGQGQAINRAKIMVVDDDPDLRQALSLRLRANHFDTLNVCDGYSAIAMAQKEKPHLIILDLGLPACDGFAVLKNLQHNPTLAGIPIIVLTARDPEGNEKRTLESGAVAFFQKPVDNEELLSTIRASLQAGWGWRGSFSS